MTRGRQIVLCTVGSLLLLAACSTAVKVEPPLAERRGTEHNQLGIAAEEQDFLPLAAEEFRQAYRFYASIEHEAGVATALINLARVERHGGRPTEAWVAAEQALFILPPTAPLRSEATFEAALVLQALQRTDEALAKAQESLQAAPESVRGRQRNLVARLVLERGDRPQAKQLATQALQENRNAKNRREEANSLRLLGEIARAGGEKTVATEFFAQALALDKALGLSSRIGDDLLALGDLAVGREGDDTALDYWRRAWEVRINSGDHTGATVALARAVVWLQGQGRAAEATALQERGHRISLGAPQPASDAAPRQNTP